MTLFAISARMRVSENYRINSKPDRSAGDLRAVNRPSQLRGAIFYNNIEMKIFMFNNKTDFIATLSDQFRMSANSRKSQLQTSCRTVVDAKPRHISSRYGRNISTPCDERRPVVRQQQDERQDEQQDVRRPPHHLR